MATIELKAESLMTTEFIHLQTHSDYSLVDSIISIAELVTAAKQQQMMAIALTDRMNLFAAIKFYRAAVRQGIKPIIGCDILIPQADEAQGYSRLTLLSRTNQGYQRLIELVSQAYTSADQRQTPVVARDWLRQDNDGLIALSGGIDGDIGQALLQRKSTEATALARQWAADFPGRFYLELQRIGNPQEEVYIEQAIGIADTLQLPIVASNAVRFIQQEDFDAHEARVCIHQGYTLTDEKRPGQYSDQQYLRNTEQMQQLFADLPEAITNSVEIAKRCNVQLTFGDVHLPNFPIPADTTVEAYLIESAKAGLIRRLDTLFANQAERLATERPRYEQRLAMELEVINSMGFAGYFLIVADFIQWAKQHDIPVGPGRGSGAGSLVAYALQITDLDPLTYDLLFERFLNPERVSMPDFDIDFCMLGRDRVIDYVAQTYGRDSVAQIITYGSMAARAVVRDVGRVLGHSYGFVDKVAKLIPFEIGMTLTKALAQEELLQQRYQQEEEVTALLDLALKLEGLVRNVGKHAGGVVIAPSKLTDFVPLYCEAGEASIVTQFDKDDVEAVGLVKFDFLGLRTLTIIQWTLDQVNAIREQQGEAPLDINRIPLDDPTTYALLKNCQTTAVFQLESRGMKDLIKRLQPDLFEEIVALVALFRPGPLQSGMVDDFINRKHGRDEVRYPHPELEPILQPTYGVILYQEQVMQIAQVLAGYTLGAADLLRRAMGKKKPEEMAKQRSIFLTGATERGVEQSTAEYIFDLMEKFAGYGFNKSHSAAYALLAYQTAWLKAHYPAAFMAAVLSSDMDNTDKIVVLLEDCRQLGLTVLSPDVNRSDYQFTVADEQTIVYGLGAIKGIGEAAIRQLRQEVQQNGPFTDLFNLCARIDAGKVNRRVLEALIRSGGLDALHDNRATLMASLPTALKSAEQRQQARTLGQHDLFGASDSEEETAEGASYIVSQPWSDLQRLQGEKETLGVYFSGHPLQYYQSELQHIVSSSLGELNPQVKPQVTVAGLITSMRRLQTKRGDRMAVLTLDDGDARVDVTLFSDVLNDYQALLAKDQVTIVSGEVSVDEYTDGYRITAQHVYDLASARQQFASHLLITLRRQSLTSHQLAQLHPTLFAHQGGQCPVRVYYQQGQAEALLQLGQKWRVQPTDELVTRLQELYGEHAVSLVYREV
jgi:DNA polymerase-3 subunit alpha